MKNKILYVAISSALLLAVSNVSQAATRGFLDESEAPSVITLIDPPPAEGSALYANDVEKFQAGQKLKDTPRWRVAAWETDMKTAGLLAIFSEAMGIEMSKEKTPEIYKLIKKSASDIRGFGSKKIKSYYSRTRPFVKFNVHTCKLDEEEEHAHGSSYPSSHSATGWGTALLLSEINPARADRLLEKGRDYGENRVICGYHWDSDVKAARNVAAVMVSALHANKDFNEQMLKAKAEFESLK